MKKISPSWQTFNEMNIRFICRYPEIEYKSAMNDIHNLMAEMKRTGILVESKNTAEKQARPD